MPARFQANATFAFHPSRLDTIYRFTPAGSTTEPQAMPTRDGALVGRPAVEWSALNASTVTTGTKVGLYGDFFAGYLIADRIGMTAQIVQHLFGASRRPTGQRGFFAFGGRARRSSTRPRSTIWRRADGGGEGVEGRRGRTFQAGTKDGSILVHAGDVLPARSAVVKGRQELFVALEQYHQTGGTPPKT